MDLVSVVIYDEKGAVVMSTDGYIGFTLSQNPEDDEYALWTLLNNADVNLMREKNDGTGFYAAVRRLDAPGLICVTLTNSALSTMREQTDVNEALLRVNTDTYAKAFVSAAEPGTMLWATATSTKARSIPNSLPESALLARIIPTSLILALAILFISCVYREIDDWLKDDYTGDSLFAQNPVSAYLFSNQWEHKLGIFSITTILLSVAFAVIGVALLKKLLEILSGRMNPRAKTISNLIASIVQFAVVVAVAIYALYQLGVDTTVILTSAGVLTLIIGYGSQSIVRDLVSGLFLIMEDQVRIGGLIEGYGKRTVLCDIEKHGCGDDVCV